MSRKTRRKRKEYKNKIVGKIQRKGEAIEVRRHDEILSKDGGENREEREERKKGERKQMLEKY